jgi:hypothetical protein
MIPGRLRQCLKVLRWKPADLADELDRREDEVKAWIEGRAAAPLAVSAWIEALVRAHEALPPPRRSSSAPRTGTERIEPAEIRLTRPVAGGRTAREIPAHPFNPRQTIFTNAAGARSVQPLHCQ